MSVELSLIVTNIHINEYSRSLKYLIKQYNIFRVFFSVPMKLNTNLGFLFIYTFEPNSKQ